MSSDNFTVKWGNCNFSGNDLSFKKDTWEIQDIIFLFQVPSKNVGWEVGIEMFPFFLQNSSVSKHYNCQTHKNLKDWYFEIRNRVLAEKKNIFCVKIFPFLNASTSILDKFSKKTYFIGMLYIGRYRVADFCFV